MQILKARTATQLNFASFGQLVETAGHDATPINAGRCARYSDVASIDICPTGRAGISIFDSHVVPVPVQISHLERHPLGSQTFLPMTTVQMLIVVAGDSKGVPTNLQAFITDGQQGISYARNVWHAVLMPLRRGACFAVIDYMGEGDNLEKYYFDNPFCVEWG